MTSFATHRVFKDFFASSKLETAVGFVDGYDDLNMRYIFILILEKEIPLCNLWFTNDEYESLRQGRFSHKAIQSWPTNVHKSSSI